MKGDSTPLKKRSDWRQTSFIPEEIRKYAKSIQLIESTRGSSLFHCPFCNVDIEPTKSFLEKHVSDIKHRKKTAIYNSEKAFPLKTQEPIQTSNSIKVVEQSINIPIVATTRVGNSSPQQVEIRRDPVFHSQQALVELQENCYCFYCGYYFYRQGGNTDSKVKVELPIMPLSLKDFFISSSCKDSLQICSTELLEPPWLTSVLKQKFSCESIYYCLSEELKLFERYLSYHSLEESERRQVFSFVQEKLQNIDKSSLVVLDDISIQYYLPFDSILLSLSIPQWNNILEQRLQQQLDENNNQWQFSHLLRVFQRGTELLWITEQVVGVSIQVVLITEEKSNISHIEKPLSVILEDTELRCIMLCIKYMIYLQLDVCHFSDIYVSWLLLLLLQDKKVECFLIHKNNTRGYILLQLLQLLGQILSHVANGYPEDWKLFTLSENEKYLKDIYASFGDICRQAYQILMNWENNYSSPIGRILPCNQKLFSLLSIGKRN